ncbi:MAG: hypothetical protein KC443_00300, partial [Anaerolineales bacterium]|nr:hypothetical protein [Anaerolineales bacterium]
KTTARCAKDGAKAGILSGAVVGLFVYMTLVSPLTALAAYRYMSEYHPTFSMPLPPTDVVLSYVQTFSSSVHLIDLTILLMAIFGGVQGALVGWRQREEPLPEEPRLFRLLEGRHHPKSWFVGNETAVKSGLLVGVTFGIIVFATVFGEFYVGFTQDWPELMAIMQEHQAGMFVTGPLQEALPLLWPFIFLGLLIYGGVVVALIRNPPDLFKARFRAVLLATSTIFLFLFSILLRNLYFLLGLAPFGLFHWMQANPEMATELPEEALALMQTIFFLQKPQALLSGALILPWIMLLLVSILGLFWGSLQSFIYIPTVSMFIRRPVDKAALLYHRLVREPQQVLPLIYGLFHFPDAYDVLAHLASRAYRSQPDVARLAAAYHTLSSSQKTEDHLQTIHAIQDVLVAHPDWRWSADLGSVYRALHQVLAARTLEQILHIDQLPQQQTTSLPPAIVKCVDGISRIIHELHKTAQVDNLSTQAIFLENALEAIHEAQRYVSGELSSYGEVGTSLPEYIALTNVLDHWQGIVLAAIKRLKGRADVNSQLQCKQCVRTASLPLVWQVANHGLNVAQQVRLRVLPGADYHSNDNEALIDILPPGEAQQVMIPVTPRDGVRRMRVEWQIIYDDAVDAAREITFGDLIEFTEPDKPFQRIFPIPYVTGTPLKTDDVFVGRDDVFAFIRENLVGAHQNNVIILHGQRRTGKTSVLYRLGQVMSDTHYGVLIDMQGKPARGEVDFLYSIADDIVFALEDRGVEVDLPDRAAFEAEGPEFYFRSRFIRSLYPHLGDKNLLLMFDEFEELQRRVEDGRLQPEIFQFLRNLMQHERRVDFVFSGTHKLEDLGAEYWSILFNIAAYKPITFLSPGEVERLMLEPVLAYNVEYDPLAIDRIIHITAGHPYFTQLVLHEMIVYHNETQRNYLTVADVNQVLERIVERGEAHFKYIWSESTEEERAVLLGFTELMVGEKPANVEDLRRLLHQRGRDTADDWTHALASLEGRDILARRSPRSQIYRFKVDLIRLWIERTRPAL